MQLEHLYNNLIIYFLEDKYRNSYSGPNFFLDPLARLAIVLPFSARARPAKGPFHGFPPPGGSSGRDGSVAVSTVSTTRNPQAVHRNHPTMSEDTSINKAAIIKEFGANEQDTGSCEVQIALLTARVKHLTEHLRDNRKDFHSRRGLIAMTARRRKLLDYLKRTDFNRYTAILEKLQLRR